MAETLFRQQLLEGHDSELTTLTTNNLWQEPWKFPIETFSASLDHFLLRNGTKPTQMSVFRNILTHQRQSFNRLPGRKNIHLHWVEGILNSLDIEKFIQSGSNVVWTLHDMAPFTGGCHHAFECQNYFSKCATCPQSVKLLNSIPGKRMSLKLENKKVFEKVTFVSPSTWMKTRAMQSALLRNAEHYVIENPIRPEFFGIDHVNPNIRDSQFKDTTVELVFCVVANNLQDRNKNIQSICDAFVEANTSSQRKMKLVLLGGKGDFFKSTIQNITWIEPESVHELIYHLDRAHVIISASDAESYGLSVAEGQSRGLKSIVGANTAASELIHSKQVGLIFESPRELTNAILQIANIESTANQIRETIKSRNGNNPEEVSRRYSELYLG